MKNCRVLIASKEIEKLFDNNFFSNIPHRFLKKGEVCYPETPRILVLKEGELKISLYEDSKELILYFLHKNNFCFCNNDIMVTAKEDSKFYFLESHHFIDLFNNIDFCNLLLNNLNQNIEMERNILKSLAFKSAKERISDFLLDLAQSIGKATNEGIIIDIHCTMEESASFLGMSRQRFSTFINEMINENILEKLGHKKILIKDLRKLENFAKE
ncbi:putative carbon monoxide oxidation system transcription regulator CooA-1 [Nautilia profundicola AmH]|uniref:Carbon monoxide oxidation system transcription regulator CooA-1 n=1 Tax=Nautilia profundicola (strain ATCC BAA-1463 / DSM 18972 / AmH) TaxID=598659 RepID=B9L8N9_NAUPA|nr:Crp/Fnr family transcriptional regulator [Nautilia profundicola]ACM92238.1 putative carbon monoxide oxidation system transcription regulator CooA-1 [Nautilia profundicola AmH]